MAASCSNSNTSTSKTECTSPSPTETVLELIDSVVVSEVPGPSREVSGDARSPVIDSNLIVRDNSVPCPLNEIEEDEKDNSEHEEDCEEDGWEDFEEGEVEAEASCEEGQGEDLLDVASVKENAILLPPTSNGASAINARVSISANFKFQNP